MVSEFMLQQTPVERVRVPWAAWLERWPTPEALAAASAGEAVRAWGRLGYPRRALRLHQAAVAITERFDGQVPADLEALRSLPGVGSYTAAAICQLRVRAAGGGAGHQRPPGDHPGGARRRLPDERSEPAGAGRGRSARSPRTGPGRALGRGLDGAGCAGLRGPDVRAAPSARSATSAPGAAPGAPAWTGPPRRGQAYAGTDRQARGALLAVLRSADEPVSADELTAAWSDPAQRERALASLIADGLVVAMGSGRCALTSYGASARPWPTPTSTEAADRMQD